MRNQIVVYMKTLLQIAAGVSLLLCFLAGLMVIIPALSSPKSDGFMLVAVGLQFMGVGVFLGGLLFVAADRFAVKR